jgi:uncharacterized protein YukE/regulator of replication initiation timing
MAEQQDLVFEFGANVTKFNAAIEEVTKEIKELKAVIGSTTSEIPKLNSEISSLETNLTKTKNVGAPTAAAIKKVRDSASDARVTLTNVSQVVQDLPFGFIGIQNNIPGVVQSFTNLTSGATGLVGGLKAIGAALIGPAGIFLAFSLVTSVTTALISKYGSLGAAFDAFFGKSNKLTKQILDTAKAYEEYNKNLRTNGQLTAEATGSVDAQITKAKFLQSEIENLTYSDNFRKIALQELIKLDRTRFENFDIEKGKLDGLSTAVDNYSESLLRNAVAKIYENKLAESAVSLNTQRDLLAEIAKGYDEVAARRKAQSLEGPIFDPATGAEIAKPFIGTKNLDKQFEAQKKIVDESIKQYDKLKQSYIEAFDAALLFTQLDTPKPGKEPNPPKPPKPDKEIKLFDFLGYSLPKNIKDDFEATLKEFEKGYNKFTRLIKNKDKFLKPTLSPFQLEKPTLEGLQTDETKAKLAELQNIAQGYLRVKDLLQSSFFEPLSKAFETFFTKGTFAIKDFTNALLTSIGQIAAKLAATAIVNGLISLFAVPFGGAFAAGGLLGGIGNLLGGIGGRAGSANFGGVQGGGMGMSGSVNMVLRGTDLVGSINRTNSQISRVG